MKCVLKGEKKKMCPKRENCWSSREIALTMTLTFIHS